MKDQMKSALLLNSLVKHIPEIVLKLENKILNWKETKQLVLNEVKRKKKKNKRKIEKSSIVAEGGESTLHCRVK